MRCTQYIGDFVLEQSITASGLVSDGVLRQRHSLNGSVQSAGHACQRMGARGAWAPCQAVGSWSTLSERESVCICADTGVHWAVHWTSHILCGPVLRPWTGQASCPKGDPKNPRSPSSKQEASYNESLCRSKRLPSSLPKRSALRPLRQTSLDPKLQSGSSSGSSCRDSWSLLPPKSSHCIIVS